MNPIRHCRQHRMPAWQAGLLLLVLLAAQWLSLAHRVEHGLGPQLAAPAALQNAAADHPSLAQGHDAGGAACQLLDHLGLADALHTAAAVPATLPPQSAVPALPLRSVGHRPAPAAFLARAPPSA